MRKTEYKYTVKWSRLHEKSIDAKINIMVCRDLTPRTAFSRLRNALMCGGPVVIHDILLEEKSL